MHKAKQARSALTQPLRSSRLLLLEFLEISRAVAVGFLVMGFIGFAVKLVHIPINNILVRFGIERR